MHKAKTLHRTETVDDLSLDSRHFAVEDYLDEIVGNIQRFYLERVVKVPV